MHEPRLVHALEKRDRKSTSSYCTYLEENLVTRQGKGQNVIPCSSVEYEAMDLVPFLRVESSWASSFLLLSLSLSSSMVNADKTRSRELSRYFEIREDGTHGGKCPAI